VKVGGVPQTEIGAGAMHEEEAVGATAAAQPMGAVKEYRCKSLVLVKRPEELPSAELGTHFGVVEADAPTQCPEGGMLVKVKYFSVDPYMRYRYVFVFALGLYDVCVYGRVLSHLYKRYISLTFTAFM
jgi:hypothetical protein